MYGNYNNSGGNVTEEIQILNSISRVSARLARNLSLLTKQRQSEGKKKKSYGENERNVANHRRPAQCCCRY